ncbi:hypothetical protein [Nocardiopsis alkaliphila]|uniref:hypothetical protein n=1 Tax=Nocardiopsis alkaliphila TaxID=225762 RepID=UPI00034566A8|nr:hypothetical protein [Nocardiopsis alkaliphila]
MARTLLRRSRRGGGSTEEIFERAERLAERNGYGQRVREAALSLLDPADGIIVARQAGDEKRFLINGQHRAQALVEAGARRTVVLTER